MYILFLSYEIINLQLLGLAKIMNIRFHFSPSRSVKNFRFLFTAQDSHSSGYDYALDDLPVCIKGNDENLPVRWKAPECLRKHSYSTASDGWAFGVLMYEVLTLGCRPYKNIREDVEVANYVRTAHKAFCARARATILDETS